MHEPDYKHLIAFLKAMEFSTITRRVAEKSGIDASAVEADARSAAGHTSAPRHAGPRQKRRRSASQSPQAKRGTGRESARRPHPHRARHRAQRGGAHRQDRPLEKRMRAHADALKEWIARAHDSGVVAVDTETTSLDAMQAGLCGFSLAVAPV